MGASSPFYFSLPAPFFCINLLCQQGFYAPLVVGDWLVFYSHPFWFGFSSFRWFVLVSGTSVTVSEALLPLRTTISMMMMLSLWATFLLYPFLSLTWLLFFDVFAHVSVIIIVVDLLWLLFFTLLVSLLIKLVSSYYTRYFSPFYCCPYSLVNFYHYFSFSVISQLFFQFFPQVFGRFLVFGRIICGRSIGLFGGRLQCPLEQYLHSTSVCNHIVYCSTTQITTYYAVEWRTIGEW